MAVEKEKQRDIIDQPMMSLTYVGVKNSPIPLVQVQALNLSYSIERIDPIGTLVITDPDGVALNSGRYSSGSVVKIKIQESGKKGQDSGKVFEFDDFYIHSKDVTYPFEKAEERSSCVIILHLVSRWRMQQDRSPHAYPAQIISKNIKNVLDDASRGFKVKYNKKSIEDTVDFGNKPLYKYGLGDLDWLQQEVLPKCMVDGFRPVYMYLNESGWFNMKSFKTLASESPKTALICDFGNFTEEEIAQRGKFLEYRNFTPTSLDELQDLVDRVCKAYTIYSETDNKIYNRVEGLNGETADEKKHYWPINSTFKKIIDNFDTKRKIIQFVPYDDFVAYSKFISRDEFKTFTLKGVSEFSVNATLGDVVTVFFDSGNQSVNVFTTNYVVGEINYLFAGDSVKTELNLFLPNYVKGEEEKQTLDTTEVCNTK